jgi:uncharacterized protein (TIGR03790 family)
MCWALHEPLTRSGRACESERTCRSEVRLLHLVLGLVLLLSGWRSQAAEDRGANVVLLANSEDPGSLRIAKNYAELRGVPAKNILAIPMPQAETISWPEFVGLIWDPLQSELVRRGWIDAIPMNLRDSLGRRKLSVAGHRISYLIVCRGVPLRINHHAVYYNAAPPLTDRSIFRTNAGAVDGELSLLAVPNHEINAYLPNPLFGWESRGAVTATSVVKVTRLDGPSVEDAIGITERAIAAEASGLSGQAFIDLGGVHPDGDRWLQSVLRELETVGFTPHVDREPTTFSADAPFAEPVLYFGWYADRIQGPFARLGFRFPVGAVAMHIHSYSATTLRDPDEGWCGPFVARGVTATVGNVFEPYLQLTHRPDYLVRALLRGESFGDAVYHAQPALSWQTVAIGDPLYRPFARKPSLPHAKQ